jgi:dTMP kinase
MEWCKTMDAGLLKPDLVIFLDIPPEDASRRGQFGEERYERLDFQEKVRRAFLELRELDWKVSCK